MITATNSTTVALHVFDRFQALDAMGYGAQEPTTGPRNARPVAVLVNVLRSIRQGQEAVVEFVNPEASAVEFTLTLDCEDGVVRICE